ncbi:FtsX-like permease family protein [Cellulomonas sp.]|uniref:FtsX-like permease family protein n=1 Tax=Cellulomonas sp. TaxID=40001 RepID=UPI001B04C631|nr:FtsX-like permease family protein [Cellulomonas sp.]MBO9555153.1 hypothetical protein [Cellulomonas sp.]
MRELLWRRGRAQAAVLVAVLAVMVVGSALVGTCVLLTTAAPQRALQLTMVRAAQEDVAVGVALGFPEDPDDPDVGERVAATARDASDAVAQASSLLTAPFGDLPTTRTTWTSTVMRYLPPDGGPLRLAYLAELDDPDARGTVASGRWPDAPGEIALPTSAARALGLDVGSATTLAEVAGGPGQDLTVVGTFVPRPGTGWTEDPLDGEGARPNYRGHIAAYGPFVVAPGGVAASALPLRRVTLHVQPDLTTATAADLARAATGVDALPGQLDSTFGDRAENVVADLPFARTIGAARDQGRVTGSGVLAVALLGGALAATTVMLSARLVAGRRAAEAALLGARGVGRGRLVLQAGVEAAVLALLAVAPATVLALALYGALAGAVGLGPAGVPEGGVGSLVASVAAVSLVLGALLVVPWLRTTSPRGTREDRVGVVVRSGADLLLLALAVVAYLQLRAHRVTSSAAVDPVLVVAPVVCVVAGAVLLLRPLAWFARRIDARASSTRSLTLPLAAWGIARRRQGAAAAFLLVLATACATFGAGFAATWAQSQRDQAEAVVGTDLSVAAQPGALGTGATLREVTGGEVSPVTSRTTTLGSRTQSGEGAVHLVAVDTRDADGLLRPRVPGGWTDATAGLAPADPVGGVRLSGTTAQLAVSGHVTGDAAVSASISLVVQDDEGARATLPAGVVELDGTPHALAVAVPQDALVVAVDTRLSAAGDAADPDQQSSPDLTVDVLLRDATLAPGGAWSAGRPPGEDYVVASLADVTADEVADGVLLTLDGTASLPGLYWSDGTLTALAFRPVGSVPVVVSARLADALGLEVGDGMQLTLGLTPVRAEVAGITAYVPSQPRAPAVLADVDTLSRAALSDGHLDPLTDAWWVGGTTPADAAESLVAAGVGPVTERTTVADENAEGPLRAALRAAAALLVVAAVVLALVGTAMHATAALEARELDVARLRGLGASRRSVLASVLAEQGVLTGLPVLCGVVLGALACWAVGPLLVVSAEGLPPVPAAAVSWPWPAQVAAVLVVLVGCAALVVPLAARTVRRSTIARLRMDGTA